MVTWEIVEAPHGRYNRTAAEKVANSVLIDSLEFWLEWQDLIDQFGLRSTRR